MLGLPALALPKPRTEFLKRSLCYSGPGHSCGIALPIMPQRPDLLLRFKCNQLPYVPLALPHGKHVNQFYYFNCPIVTDFFTMSK